MAHCENGELIDYNATRLVNRGVMGPEGHLYSRGGEIEAQAVHTAVTIASVVNNPLYVVHVMKKSSA
jgi:dihydroorotase-like cyclic amidohydrolase